MEILLKGLSAGRDGSSLRFGGPSVAPPSHPSVAPTSREVQTTKNFFSPVRFRRASRFEGGEKGLARGH